MYYKRIYQVIEEEIYQKKCVFQRGGGLGKTKNNKLLKNLGFINALQINQFSRD